MTSRRLRPASLTLLAVLPVIALGACKSGDGTQGSGGVGSGGVGEVRAGSTAQLANCTDWRGGTPAQRYATIRDIRGQLTPQTSRSEDTGLPDDVAYGIFEKSCATDGAERLRLYKLYARAQAFAPYRDDARD